MTQTRIFIGLTFNRSREEPESSFFFYNYIRNTLLDIVESFTARAEGFLQEVEMLVDGRVAIQAGALSDKRHTVASFWTIVFVTFCGLSIAAKLNFPSPMFQSRIVSSSNSQLCVCVCVCVCARAWVCVGVCVCLPLRQFIHAAFFVSDRFSSFCFIVFLCYTTKICRWTIGRTSRTNFTNTSCSTIIIHDRSFERDCGDENNEV